MSSTLDQTLENGLRVVIQPTASALAGAVLWIDAGAVDERDGETGAAHFLEHMLFKGTARRGIGGSTAAIEALGGELEAFTAHDETALHAVVDGGSIEDALDVLADMVRHPTLDAEEFERERTVVLEEVRGYESDPDTVLDDAVSEMLFDGHPYGRPVTGTSDQVARLRWDAVVGFRAREHGPRRATLAVAGGVSPDQVLAVARRLFGGWDGPAAPRVLGDAPAAVLAPAVRKVSGGFEHLAAQVGFRAPPFGHPDQAALEVLATAIGDGPSSWLSSRLVVEQDLATDAWASASTYLRGGSLVFGAPPRDGKSAAVVSALLDEIAHVRARGLSARFVRRAQDVLLADALFNEESVDSVAQDLAWYAARHGRPQALATWRSAVAAVTPADVARVAAEWLDPERAVVGVLDDRLAEARVRKAVQTPRPVARRRLEPVQHRHDNGAVVWILPDETPVCAITACARGGAAHETSRNQGLAEAWARTVAAGAGDLDAGDFGAAFDDVSGGISGAASRTTLSLRANLPAASAAEGLELFGMAWAKPRFDKDDVARTVDELRDDLRERADHADDQGVTAMWEAMFPDHPFGASALGTLRSLDALGPGALHKLHGGVVTARNTVIAVAGGVDPDEALAALTPWLDELPDGGGKAPKSTPLPAAKPGLRNKTGGRGSAFVGVGLRGAELAPRERTALAIACAVLDGQGGRLFLDLRERRGLAYDVWADVWSGPGASALTFGLTCDPAHAAEAIDALRAGIVAFPTSPPTEAEVARYQRMIRGRTLLAMERAAARSADAAEGALFGRPFGLPYHLDEIASVRTVDVEAAVARAFAVDRVEVVVTPDG